jgi:hypothetical protein
MLVVQPAFIKSQKSACSFKTAPATTKSLMYKPEWRSAWAEREEQQRRTFCNGLMALESMLRVLESQR